MLLDIVPPGHKVALVDLPEGTPVLRYGEVIEMRGQDDRSREPGSTSPSFVCSRLPRSSICCSRRVRRRSCRRSTDTPSTAIETRMARSARRTSPWASLPASNALPASRTSSGPSRQKEVLLPRYPNVDDVVALTHAYGCGVAINAPAAVVPIRTLQNLARNPNFGGEVMVISLGCEKLQPERLLPAGRIRTPRGESTDPLVLRLQDESFRGFEMVAAMMEMAEKRLSRMNRRRRETCPASRPGGRRAVRRQRRLLRRHRQSRGRLCGPTCWCAPAPR